MASYSTVWSITNISNVNAAADGYGSRYNNGFSANNTNYTQAIYCSQLQYVAWHTRTRYSTATTISPTLHFASGDVYMGSIVYNMKSSGAVGYTYVRNFDYTTSPTAIEVGNYVRSGLTGRTITWTPVQSSSNRLYYRATAAEPIGVTAIFQDVGGGVKYYDGTNWQNCLAYYYDGSAFRQCEVFYYDGTSYHRSGF